MKKFFKVFAVMALALGLIGCSKSGEAKTVKVGVAIYSFDDNFMTLYRGEIESYFKTKETSDVKYEVTTVDAKKDQATQTEQIDTFIAQNMDLIIANLVQPTSADTIVAKCKEADIPLVFINREPDAAVMESWEKVTYVGADAKQSGTFQGEIIAELPNKGDINGDGKVSYVMIVGDPDNVDAQYRTQFSIEALEKAIPVEKLAEERGMWEQARGQEIMASALAQYGDKIEVVFANNDGMGLGALEALVSAGRVVGEDIYLVGVDALPEVVAKVETGEFTGTVLNDHIGQSHKAVDVAIELLDGKTVENNYTIPYVKVVKE